jgi:hypothetical protein
MLCHVVHDMQGLPGLALVGKQAPCTQLGDSCCAVGLADADRAGQGPAQ